MDTLVKNKKREHRHLIPTVDDREIAMLEKVEHEIRRHERREHIHHAIMGGLGLLAVAAYFVGRRHRR